MWEDVQTRSVVKFFGLGLFREDVVDVVEGVLEVFLVDGLDLERLVEQVLVVPLEDVIGLDHDQFDPVLFLDGSDVVLLLAAQQLQLVLKQVFPAVELVDLARLGQTGLIVVAVTDRTDVGNRRQEIMRSANVLGGLLVDTLLDDLQQLSTAFVVFGDWFVTKIRGTPLFMGSFE